MTDASRLRAALHAAITCLPLLAGCKKREPDPKPTPEGAATATSSKSTTAPIVSVATTKSSACNLKYHSVVSRDDAEKLPHGAATSLGCPTTIELAAAGALGLQPEFGELRRIELSESCTKSEQATNPKSCVYMARIDYGPEGRPAVEAGRSVVASAVAGDEWRRGRLPAVAHLSSIERAARRDRWLSAARAEHASIASFARTIGELMAVAAPPGLLAAASRALADEIRHAEMAFAIASAYAGAPIDPGPMPILHARRGGLLELVRTTFFEGCVAETSAALRAERDLDRETDDAVRAALWQIVRDETRHAELAWQTLAWALQVGGPEARRVLDACVCEASRETASEAWESVVVPSLAALAA